MSTFLLLLAVLYVTNVGSVVACLVVTRRRLRQLQQQLDDLTTDLTTPPTHEDLNTLKNLFERETSSCSDCSCSPSSPANDPNAASPTTDDRGA